MYKVARAQKKLHFGWKTNLNLGEHAFNIKLSTNKFTHFQRQISFSNLKWKQLTLLEYLPQDLDLLSILCLLYHVTAQAIVKTMGFEWNIFKVI